ncbi:MAG: LemA family protein [Muribaculaceae bacterium]|nr:LemA family protein [Muribaculaceae bacterium]
MKKLISRIICALAIIFGTASLSSCNYNSLVEEQQGVDQAWAEVENQYQRRADLIPNLVNTVKGYSSHEEETLVKVTEARAQATSININADDLDEETLAKFQEAQNQLTSALKSLLSVAEAYPDLKANESFLNLQTQLEGTENRITIARRNYTEAVRDYNTQIKKFPTNIYAGWFGFKPKPQFTALSGAERAPEVKF